MSDERSTPKVQHHEFPLVIRRQLKKQLLHAREGPFQIVSPGQ